MIKKHYSYYNPQDGKYYVDKPYSLRDNKVSPSASPVNSASWPFRIIYQ